jgi:putative redox protein
MEVRMQWKGGLAFEGTSAFGSVVRTDAAREVGGEESGAKPTELLLYGIAGCTGIDILRILEKQRQEITDLSIRVEAEQNEDYPKPFHTVRVHYIATGKGLDPRRLAKAIELSESKYCVVSQTVQQPATVTTSWEIVEAG